MTNSFAARPIIRQIAGQETRDSIDRIMTKRVIDRTIRLREIKETLAVIIIDRIITAVNQ